jgi:hypothetical protein
MKPFYLYIAYLYATILKVILRKPKKKLELPLSWREYSRIPLCQNQQWPFKAQGQPPCQIRGY